MGGNALTIRVHKDRNTVEQCDGDDDDCGCNCLPGGGKQKKKSSYAAPPGQGTLTDLLGMWAYEHKDIIVLAQNSHQAKVT